MSEKKPFTLTAKAGPVVAGQRIKAGQTTVMLTEAEAAYELREQTIARETVATAAVDTPSKRRRAASEGASKGDESV